MSMNDTYALATAIITNQRLKLVGPDKTMKAGVVFANIHCDHRSHEFSGSVNFLVEGEQIVRVEAFYNMWKMGWEAL